MNILIADDQPLFRYSLAHLVEEVDPSVLIHEADDYGSAIDQCRLTPFDLALVDLCMPGFNNGEALSRLRDSLQTAPLVVISAIESAEHIRKTLALGVQGYILKTSDYDILMTALRLVMAGGCYIAPSRDAPAGTACPPLNYSPSGLTDREVEVLRLLAEGHANKTIARRLNISRATVNTHVSSICRVLDVQSRTQAGWLAEQMGLL